MQAAATGTLKRSQEEPPHVRSQGQKPGGPHARRAAANRSYPTSEVRDSGQEYQTVMAQEQRRGATPHPRSGVRPRGDTQRPRTGAETRGITPRPTSVATAGRRYPMPHARGQGQRAGGATPRPNAQSQGRRPGGPTPRLRPEAATGRTNPTSKEQCLPC